LASTGEGCRSQEGRADTDLAPDFLIPEIPAAQFTFVEPDLDPGSEQCGCDSFSRRRVLEINVVVCFEIVGIGRRPS
jgi:hypothetical protein